MTIDKIILEVSRARRRVLGKKMKCYTPQAIHRNLRKLKIKPLGRTSRAIYPDNAADKIIVQLGLKNGGAQ